MTKTQKQKNLNFIQDWNQYCDMVVSAMDSHGISEDKMFHFLSVLGGSRAGATEWQVEIIDFTKKNNLQDYVSSRVNHYEKIGDKYKNYVWSKKI